jgi:cytochrome oxidase assembly protein ShyY1
VLGVAVIGAAALIALGLWQFRRMEHAFADTF